MREYVVIYKPDRDNWMIVKQTVLGENHTDASQRVLSGFVNSQLISVYPLVPEQGEKK
jgi:hypothetical protein